MVVVSALSALVPPGAGCQPPGPREVLERFNRYLEGGHRDSAAAWVTGSAARALDFMLLAQEKFRPFIDTTRSLDTVLEERIRGDAAWIRAASEVHFTKRVLGQDSLHSVMAVHFTKRRNSWLIASLEELPRVDSPIAFRAAPPESAGAGGSREGSPEKKPGAFLPVSTRYPKGSGSLDSAEFVLRTHSHTPLPSLLDTSAWQTLTAAPGEAGGRVRTRAGSIPPPPAQYESTAYLDATGYFRTQEVGLRRIADSLGSPRQGRAAYARAVYHWVRDNLELRYGATLFGTSDAILKDMRGDCSEAAVLTTALLRAGGAPARVVLGLAHAHSGVFVGHAWTEVWLAGGWVPLDAALGQFPAGAGRIRFRHLDDSIDLRVQATNLLLGVLADLEVEFAAAWRSGRPLPLAERRPGGPDDRTLLEAILGGAGL